MTFTLQLFFIFLACSKSLITQYISSTAGEDYNAISQQLTFGSSIFTPSCVTVDTVPDSVLEDNETFFLTLHKTDSSLALIPKTAIVIIKDNTSKP